MKDFETYAERYRVAYAEGLPSLSSGQVPAHLSEIFHPCGGRLLDVGCGEGFAARHLASIGYRVMAIDISPTAIAKAKEINVHPLVEYMVSDIRKVPIRDNSLDGALDIGCAHLMSDPTDRRLGYISVWRLLKPGRKFYLVDGTRARQYPATHSVSRCYEGSNEIESRIPAIVGGIRQSATHWADEIHAAGFEELWYEERATALVCPMEAHILARKPEV